MADSGSRNAKGWFYDQPLKVYLPAAKTWPKLVLSAGYSHIDGKKSPKPTRWTSLAVFVQAAQGAPLKHDTSMPLLRNKLPEPLGADADPTVVDRDRAVSLARALAKHWTKDTAAVPGFASTKILDASIDEARDKPRPYSDARWTVRLLDGPRSVRTVAVEGGTLVVADYKVIKDVWAVGTGSFVFWTDDAAKVYGGDHRQSLHSTSYAGAAWFMPANGGPATALGQTSTSALF